MRKNAAISQYFIHNKQNDSVTISDPIVIKTDEIIQMMLLFF